MATSGMALRALPQTVEPHTPMSRRRIETVISRSVAIFGLLFGAQTVPAVLGQARQMHEGWLYVMVFAIFGGLLMAVVAAIAQRLVGGVNVYIAVVYLIALASWPLAVIHPTVPLDSRPWLWYLCTVATASAAVALQTWQATGYVFLAPLIYAGIRVTPAGGGAPWNLAALDATYAIILGGAVLILMTMLRSAASSVDSAQTTALTRYAHAVRQHAIEVERVQVDSIVHDSVLTTLLSAAAAQDADSMALAAGMAKNAIGHLKEAAASSPDDETAVPLSQVVKRIVGATETLSARFVLRSHPLEPGTIPVQAAEAVYSAAVQAMVNSIQHAGGGEFVHRWLSIRTTAVGGFEVQVGDTGVGFTPDTVQAGRLGLRVSILERVTNAGGEVRIDSHPGEGTLITIGWPATDAAVEAP